MFYKTLKEKNINKNLVLSDLSGETLKKKFSYYLVCTLKLLDKSW